MKLYACDNCRFLFEAEQKPAQCPDCGKFAVREATETENKEFVKRQSIQDNWFSEGG